MKKIGKVVLILLLSLQAAIGGGFVVKAEDGNSEVTIGYINDTYVGVRKNPTQGSALIVDGVIGKYFDYKQTVIIIGETTNDGYDWYKVRFVAKGTTKETEAYVKKQFVTLGDNGLHENDYEPVNATVIVDSKEVKIAPMKTTLTIDGKKQYFTRLQQLLIIGEGYDYEGDKWYHASFKINGADYDGWIYYANVQIQLVLEDDSDFETYLTSQGFPESYKEPLRQLHAQYPTWHFIAYHTNLEWETVVNKESRLGFSLIDGSNLALRSVAKGAFDVATQTFIVYDGTNWYCANKATVAYYLDPRNFLNKYDIFQFLNLSFKESETPDEIQNLLKGTFMSGNDPVGGKAYKNIFYEAGQAAGVSPIYLASLARQEQGTSGSRAVTGESFTYNGKTYSGLYNFFNIGATSGADNWKKGLIYANGGENGSNTSYGRPWKSPEKAIKGGALWIASGYVNVGQDTMYLQKFNVTPNSTYSHQYMTNIRAAYQQGRSMYSTYETANSLNQTLVFTIPVYKNICSATALPTTYVLPQTLAEQEAMESGNYTVDPDPTPEPVEYTGDFIVDLGLLNSEGYLSGFDFGITVEELIGQIKATNENYGVTISDAQGNNVDGKNKVATGYKLVVEDEDGTSNYTIIIKGDIDGNGTVELKDLLLYKKHLLDTKRLEGAAYKAALIQGISEPELKGYLVIKKYILGTANSVPQE